MPYRNTTSSLVAFLFRPVDIAPLVFFRVAFGFLMLVESIGAILIGFVHEAYIEPVFSFAYFGFEWIRPLPGDGMIYLYLFMSLLSFCILVGFRYRVACLLFFICFTWAFLIDKTNYINHHYLVILYSFLLIFLPAHLCCSLDARRKPSIRRTTIPYWPVFLILFQIAVVHLFAASAKLYPDWLEAKPLMVWLQQKTHFPLIGHLFRFPETAFIYAYGGILFDFLIVPLMIWKRSRVPAFIAATVFHFLNFITFHIGIFPFLALAATALFFPPRSFRRLVRGIGRHQTPELEGRDRPEGSAFPARASSAFPVRAPVVAFCAGWMVFQTALPLRPYVCGPDTEWTEKGHRFAWRMMLRSKTASAVFYVDVPGGTETVQTARFLTRRQERVVPSRPDMIHQMARFLEDHFEAQGRRVLGVRANSHVSLNGRPAAPFTDPDVNLLEHERRKCAAPPWLQPKPD